MVVKQRAEIEELSKTSEELKIRHQREIGDLKIELHRNIEAMSNKEIELKAILQ